MRHILTSLIVLCAASADARTGFAPWSHYARSQERETRDWARHCRAMQVFKRQMGYPVFGCR